MTQLNLSDLVTKAAADERDVADAAIAFFATEDGAQILGQLGLSLSDMQAQYDTTIARLAPFTGPTEGPA